MRTARRTHAWVTLRAALSSQRITGGCGSSPAFVGAEPPPTVPSDASSAAAAAWGFVSVQQGVQERGKQTQNLKIEAQNVINAPLPVGTEPPPTVPGAVVAVAAASFRGRPPRLTGASLFPPLPATK